MSKECRDRFVEPTEDSVFVAEDREPSGTPAPQEETAVADRLPLVSVIIPCRNEAGWIRSCLESIAGNDYPKQRIEVLVVDGLSDDGTRATVKALAEQYPFVRLLDNPKQITPAALNVGIEEARGDVIMRMDAHYQYARDYISRLVTWLQRSGADNVGGVLISRPANETAVARAIAAGTSHAFGIGNAWYRVGAAEPRWVDTVPFGCYRREVFDRIGLFDEELVRNQDIELNRRLARDGGKMLLVPEVVVYGSARDSLRKLARMYFQYGYFNPLVLKKTGGPVTSRQVATPTFVASLFLGTVLAALFPWAVVAFAGLLGVYLALVMTFSVATAVKRGWRCGLVLPVVFPLLHIAHGLGFLKGVLDFLVLGRSPGKNAGAIPLSR